MGKQLDKSIKKLVVKHFKKGITIKKLHKKIFLGDKSIVSSSHLNYLFTKFRSFEDDSQFDEYINKNASNERINIQHHGNKKFQRQSKVSILKKEFLLYEKLHRGKFLKNVIIEFNRLVHGINYNPKLEGLKLTTCQRWLKEARISTKVGEKRNIKRCELQGYHLMRLLEHVRKDQIVASDGMSTAAKYSRKRYGRSEIGKRAILPQFTIEGRTFSLYASACSRGIICWKLFEDAPVNGNDIYKYLKENLGPCLENHHVGLFDNAKVHKKKICLLEMEKIFQGNYVFCSPYSPNLNPIERVFSLIRHHLKINEEYTRLHPVEAINAACENYSVNGPNGNVCSKFFDLYETNYEVAHIHDMY